MGDLVNKSGIYKILNIENGKIYIGSAVKFKVRWYQHIWYLDNGTHHNLYLQRAWNLHSKEAFEFKIVEYVIPDKELLYIREQFWMNNFKPEYNLAPAAGSILGYRHTDETRLKISLANKGNQNNKGKKHSDHTKRLIAEGNKGKIISDETRAKMSAFQKGKKISAEARANMGKAQLGKKHSQETKAKMSASAKLRCERKRATKL